MVSLETKEYCIFTGKKCPCVDIEQSCGEIYFWVTLVMSNENTASVFCYVKEQKQQALISAK